MSAATAPAIDRNKLVMDNLGLAKCIALSRMPRSLFVTGECEDAIQEAMLGLVQAANRFDPARSKTDFRIYASYRIRGQFQDCLRHMPLVGTMRSDGDHSLQRSDKGSASQFSELFDAVEHRESHSPIGSAHFEQLMLTVCVACKPRTAEMIRMWCEGWDMAAIARHFRLSSCRISQLIDTGLRNTRLALIRKGLAKYAT
jgi:RNA polymerase sigma factor (sigma-70 family)